MLFTSLAGLIGCGTPLPEACAKESEPVTNAAGAGYRCTVSEDCPRPSHLPLCVTDTRPEQECIRCEDTWCMHAFPLPESC